MLKVNCLHRVKVFNAGITNKNCFTRNDAPCTITTPAGDTGNF